LAFEVQFVDPSQKKNDDYNLKKINSWKFFPSVCGRLLEDKISSAKDSQDKHENKPTIAQLP
jgi:hypothetical protein